MKRYLAMDIGCIECGQESAVIGIFATEQEAEAAIEAYLQPGTNWGREEWTGSHHCEVFEVDVPAATK